MYRNHNKLMVAVAFLLSLALAITLTPDLDVYAQDSVTDVDDETPVAMVGDQSFTSLQEAVDATTGDILITINKDIVGTSTTNPSEIWTMLTIPSNRTVILDLNGYTLSATLTTDGNTYGNAQVVRNEGILTIKDLSDAQSGKITASTSYGCTATVRNQGGTLIIESGSISSEGGNAIRNQNGLLTITGGSISTTGSFASFDNGVAAIHNRGDLVIEGGDVRTVNQAPIWYGEGSDDSTNIIRGGSFFSENSAVDIQGGNGTVSVMGGTFHVNPFDYIANGYYSLYENGYFVVTSEGTDVKITDEAELLDQIDNADGWTNIAVVGDVRITQDLTIPENVCVYIQDGATLSVDDSILRINGFIVNNGELDVSDIGNGFIDNLSRFKEENGTTVGLMETAADGKYHISTAAELQLMHFVMLYQCDENGIFGNDIVLTDDLDLTGYNFLPLGYDGQVAFGGTFYGNEKSINNLSIEIAYGYIGLFSVIDNATIRDVNLYVDLKTQSGVMGSISGGAFGGGNFINISASGTYTNATSYYCGGWIGFLQGSSGDHFNFLDCSNSIDVTGNFNVGAFWGSSSGSESLVTMIDCSNSGDIVATGGTVGLLGGYVNGSGQAYNFENTGSVFDKDSEVDVTNPPSGTTFESMPGIVCAVLSDGALTPYTSIQNAINASNSGDTIILSDDVTSTQRIELPSGVDLDLDMKTLTLDATPSGSANKIHILILGESTISNGTIRDESSDGTNGENNSYAIMVAETTGKLNIVNTTVQQCDPTSGYNYALYVQSGASLILGDDVTVESYGNSSDGSGAVVGASVIGSSNTTTLSMGPGVSIETSGFALAGNGAKDGTLIEISGGTLTSHEDVAIYHPHDGTLEISGNTEISGTSGIEMRSGTLTISGTPRITATGTYDGAVENDNGPTTSGVAIAVSPYEESDQGNRTIRVSISGNGSFTGDVAFMQANPNEAQNVKYDFSITGGSFTSEAADPETGEKYPAVMTDEADADKFADQKFVSGGSFSSPVDEYMPEGISTETDDDGNVVVLQPVRFTEDGISVFTSRFTLPIVIPEGATDITYTFISNDDENAATIDKDGIVTIDWSHSYIMATVTATFNGVEYTDTMDILVYRDGEVTTTDSDAGIMVSYTKKAHEEYEERDDQVIDVPVEITYPVVVDIKRADTGTEPVTVDVTDLLDHFLDGTIDGTYGHDVGEYDVLTAHFGDDVDYPVTEIYDGRVYVTMEDFSTYVFYVYQVEPDPKPDPTPGWSDDDELPPFIPTQTGGDGDTVTIVACAAAAAVAAIMAVFLIIDRKK